MSDVAQKVDFVENPIPSPGPAATEPVATEPGNDVRSLEEAVKYVLADCSFAVGQAVGMRTTVDYDAIVLWHDHFRARFSGGDASPRTAMATGSGKRDRGRLDAGGARRTTCGRPMFNRRRGRATCCR